MKCDKGCTKVMMSVVRRMSSRNIKEELLELNVRLRMRSKDKEEEMDRMFTLCT